MKERKNKDDKGHLNIYEIQELYQKIKDKSKKKDAIPTKKETRASLTLKREKYIVYSGRSHEDS